MMTARDKIKTIDEIARITREAHAAGKKIVTTNGTFDLIHVGHIRNLEEARAMGDLLIVGVNSDASVRNYKGPTRPILGEADRAEIIAGLESVSHVFIFDEPDPRPWLEKIHTDIHVKGGDWKNADKSRAISTIVEAPLLESKGAKLVLVDLVPGKSTTSIIEKIRQLP
ncbi:MAG TPA: adenylyltransferase/cytidyltransferase family protein [Candidatus Paceibacterota bacterium]|nr:adenylyltransferase/cytidyltransferase family protein [Candidatus Paceibacterota bacterium]